MESPSPSAPPPSRTQRRLAARLADDERLVAWARAWVSRPGRMHAFALRTLDFVVLTDRRVHLVSTGFFTRRPRHRVYTAAVHRLMVTECKGGAAPQLRIVTPEHRGLVLDVHRRPDGRRFADELLTVTVREDPS